MIDIPSTIIALSIEREMREVSLDIESGRVAFTDDQGNIIPPPKSRHFIKDMKVILANIRIEQQSRWN